MTKDARPWARFAARPQGPQSRSRGLVRGGALADGAGLRRRATGRASETIAAAHLLVAKEKKPATLRVWPRASLTLLGTFIHAFSRPGPPSAVRVTLRRQLSEGITRVRST
jgi:hypothetical protein